LISSLSHTQIANVKDASVNLGFINFVFSLLDIRLAQVTAGKSCPMFTANTKDGVTFQICDFTML
jgi:hypothetical protein